MKDIQLNTFSIIWFDPKTKSLWIAVASKWLAVGAIVPYIKVWVWAIATQALTNISYWPIWLELLEKWENPEDVLKYLLENDNNSEARQVSIIDINWNKAHHTWKKCFEYASWIIWKDCIVQWNMLTWENILIEMKNTFENSKEDFEIRLFNALLIAEKNWWDKRWKQSAAILVIKSDEENIEVTKNIIDLRVDDSENPLEDLKILLDKHKKLYN
jgi:uncharacterized Ntn-hydrolase superfamily protein